MKDCDFYSTASLSTHVLCSRGTEEQNKQLSDTKAKHHVKSTI